MSYTGSVPEARAHRHDWMAAMACRYEKPETFSELAHQHEARLICAIRCPVRPQCLAHVSSLERGESEIHRDGVVAGLTAHERWRLDATAPGHSDRPALTFDDDPPVCGTYMALLRHLVLGEPVDDQCWSGEVRRDRLNRVTRAAHLQPPEPKPKPEKAPVPVQPLVAAPPPEPAEPPKASPTAPPTKGGTPHERRVYRLWSKGLSDRQIALRVGLREVQVRSVRERLGLLPNLHTAKAS